MNPLENTGMLLHQPSGTFVGSCFAFRNPGVFLAAAHCLGSSGSENLLVALPVVGRHFRVVRAEQHPTADVAILIVHGMSEDDITWPHYQVFDDRSWGEDYMAFGYPEGYEGSDARPTPRIFRGHIQRFFPHTSHLGYKYLAAELSTGAPRGLSGAPVFSSRFHGRLYGVVAENVRTTSELETILEVKDGGTTRSEYYQNLINYGVAVWLPAVEPWLDGIVPPLSNDEINRRAVNQQEWREAVARESAPRRPAD